MSETERFNSRPTLRRVVKLDEVEKVPLPMAEGRGGHARIIIAKEVTGAKNFSLLVSEIEPGYAHAQEVHDEEQAYLILRGRASIMLEGKEYEVGPDTAVFVPARTVHQLRNKGSENLKLLVVTSPQGKFETKILESKSKNSS